jgi:putative copper resistance protein D
MNLLGIAFKYINLIGGVAAIGALLSMAFLLLDTDGKISTSGEKLRTYLKTSAAVWFVGVVGSIVITLAQILNTPLSGALDTTVIRSFVTQITLGHHPHTLMGL